MVGVELGILEGDSWQRCVQLREGRSEATRVKGVARLG